MLKTAAVYACIEKDKIKIAFEYSAELVEWLRTLPNALWQKQRKAWYCDLTPAAAHRLLSYCPARVEADDELREIGNGFLLDIVRAAQGGPKLQPPLRKADSWPHQMRAYDHCEQLGSAMMDVGMGGGKSKVVVDLVCNRFSRHTLILCPTSVRGVWRREFDKWAAASVSVLVLDGAQSVSKKTILAQKHLAICAGTGTPAVVVINYEAAWRGPFGDWAAAINWDMIVLDESHRIKAHDSKISKFCAQLGMRSRFKLCLTGTPLPHSPLDCFGQYRFLDAGIFGSSWHWFKNRYAIANPYIQGAIVGYKNQEELSERFGWLACRITDADLNQSLPPIAHIDRTFVLGKEAQRIYRELEGDLIAEVGAGTVTVANALVKLLRLQQITGGHVPLDDEEVVTRVDTAKGDLLTDLLTDIGEPVVVFCRFRADLDVVQAVAGSLNKRYSELSGRRHDLTERGTMPDCDIFGVQVQSGGVGIDLTRARYAVAYSLGYLSPGDYDQLIKRIHRPGQEHPTTIYHLLAEKTIDGIAYRARAERRNEIRAVLESIR